MDRRKIFIVVGLQRSGNHAVIAWLSALFPDCRFHNDNRHDLFARREDFGPLLEAGAAPGAPVIFSFEDSAKKAPDPKLPLLESVVPFPAGQFPDLQVERLHILRDPYNLWASRVVGHSRRGGAGLTSDPSWPLFRRNWLDLARLCDTDPERVVIFNRWATDPSYRRTLARRFGGIYSEKTLAEIQTAGGGSSFDRPRPSYGTLLRNWRRYVSGRKLRRILAKPAHYLGRLLKPRLTADKLRIEERWRVLRRDPETQMLFDDPEIRQVSRRIFGDDLVAALDRPASAGP